MKSQLIEWTRLQANIKYEFFGVIRDFMAELLSPGNEEYKAIFDKIYADS